MNDFSFSQKFRDNPILTLEFEPKVAEWGISFNNFDMKYFTIEDPIGGLLQLRDDYCKYKPVKLGFGTIYQAEKVSKEINPAAEYRLTRANIETWLKNNNLIEGVIEKNDLKDSSKVTGSNINLDHVEFWSKYLQGFKVMEKSQSVKDVGKGWKYVNPWNTVNGKNIKEHQIDTITDFLTGILTVLPEEKRSEFVKSLVES